LRVSWSAEIKPKVLRLHCPHAGVPDARPIAADLRCRTGRACRRRGRREQVQSLIGLVALGPRRRAVTRCEGDGPAPGNCLSGDRCVIQRCWHFRAARRRAPLRGGGKERRGAALTARLPSPSRPPSVHLSLVWPHPSLRSLLCGQLLFRLARGRVYTLPRASRIRRSAVLKSQRRRRAVLERGGRF